MSVAGRVVTGYSKPKIADYACTAGVISYSNGMTLARGVSVEISVDEGDSNNFYADNQLAESDSGAFTSGTATLTVDGLKANAEKSIQGLPTADDDGFLNYNDDRRDIGHNAIRLIACNVADALIALVLIVVVAEEAVIVRCWKSLD